MVHLAWKLEGGGGSPAITTYKAATCVAFVGRQEENEMTDEVIVKDSNGAKLADGDAVTLIKEKDSES